MNTTQRQKARAVPFNQKYGNRHGLIAGAPGTGRELSLLLLPKGFSRMGVPVFISDVKGDVSGIAAPGASER
jgi:DNA helicase HerA-like ATPase